MNAPKFKVGEKVTVYREDVTSDWRIGDSFTISYISEDQDFTQYVYWDQDVTRANITDIKVGIYESALIPYTKLERALK